MNKSAIEEKIRAELGIILAIPPRELLADKPLIEYGLDSVRAMELVVGVEEIFEVEIEDIEIAVLETLADIVGLVKSKVIAGA
ncbi:MAG: acyl carrier protein [Chloroflexota bacterium]